MLTLKCLSGILAAVFISFAAITADAALLPATQVSGNSGSASILFPMGLEDVVPVVGTMDKGNFTQTVNFKTTIDGIGNVAALNFKFLNLTDILGLSYSVDGGSLVAAPTLLVADLSAGSHYVTVIGKAIGKLGGNYELKIGVTPIPGAVLLLAPALAGLGFVSYRQRQGATA